MVCSRQSNRVFPKPSALKPRCHGRLCRSRSPASIPQKPEMARYSVFEKGKEPAVPLKKDGAANDRVFSLWLALTFSQSKPFLFLLLPCRRLHVPPCSRCAFLKRRMRPASLGSHSRGFTPLSAQAPCRKMIGFYLRRARRELKRGFFARSAFAGRAFFISVRNRRFCRACGGSACRAGAAA